jgi:SAM-dependent methyltransferase
VGLYADRVLPRITDVALGGKAFTKLRRSATAGLSGDVLEVGFGSGRNLPLLPPEVTRVFAVEPAAAGRTLAAGRIATSAIPVEFVGLAGEQLPLEDESVDHVLSTWTLCTIPGVEQALSEIRRVLRAGGSLHFLEHGLAPDLPVRRWQNRLNPIQQRVCGGCHLNRPIDELVAGAGLRIDELDTFYARGPKAMGYMYRGVASKA